MLIVLDGWGEAPKDYPREFNATRLANTPTYDNLLANAPNTLIHTSGNFVGLPKGIMGNSEVGHMNLGAGRVVWQEIVRIDTAVEKDNLRSVGPVFDAVEKARETGRRLHIMGLTSDGSVHSVDRHYIGILQLAKEQGLKGAQVAMHCFTDGRDCPPESGIGYVQAVRDWMTENGTGVIASVIGRYYAMDRDKRWERTKQAYDTLVHGIAFKSHRDPVEAVKDSYAAGETDEFIKPRIIVDAAGRPLATIEDGDQVIFVNYRADRARQLSRAFVEPGFDAFPVKQVKMRLVTMTPYIEGLPVDIAFPPQSMADTMGEIVSTAGLTQLRAAETEKYPHVTFFFSGGQEKEFQNESRILVPSPRDVPTYDFKPQMSAPELGDAVVEAIRTGRHDFVVLNFANADMVGHTGIVEAAVKACEAADAALGKVLAAVKEAGGAAIVTADHGNAEEMWNFEADAPHTQHTTNDVRLFVFDENLRNAKLREGGRLADVSPTLLKMMEMPKPPAMEGDSILVG